MSQWSNVGHREHFGIRSPNSRSPPLIVTITFRSVIAAIKRLQIGHVLNYRVAGCQLPDALWHGRRQTPFWHRLPLDFPDQRLTFCRKDQTTAAAMDA